MEKLTRQQNSDSFFKILSYVKKLVLYNLKTSMLLNQSFFIIFLILEFIIPFVYGRLINSITCLKKENTLNFYTIYYIIIIVGKYLLYLVKEKLIGIRQDTCTNTKLEFYENIIKKDIEFFERYKVSELIDIFNDDFSYFHCFEISSILRLFAYFFKMIIMISSLIYISPQLVIFIFIIFGLDFYFLINNIQNKSTLWNPYYKKCEKLTNTFTEILKNIRLIKSFSTEKKEIEKLKAEAAKVDKIHLEIQISSSQELLGTIKKIIEIIEIWYAASIVISGNFDLGRMISFQLLSSQVTNTLPNITKNITDMIKYSISKRYLSIMETKPKINMSNSSILQKSKLDGNIEFRNVYFEYPNNSVCIFHNFNLKINKGEIIAIVGLSGSGKSTLSSLFLRLYDVTKGDILIDNRSIKEYDLAYLHNRIGYVSQDVAIFNDTIKENIIYGSPYSSQERILNASMLADIPSSINDNNFPYGYSTVVGEKGSCLSGGMKQKISIARALIKDIDILILDEATSMLDNFSEKKILNSIFSFVNTNKITTVIISHRLSTIQSCSRIVVMKHGMIMDEGTHEDLFNRNTEYNTLFEKQENYNYKN